MEHKLISGGEQHLPFARSRIKAMKALGLKYASQQYTIGGATVKVRIAGEQEYINLSGGSGNIWALIIAVGALETRSKLYNLGSLASAVFKPVLVHSGVTFQDDGSGRTPNPNDDPTRAIFDFAVSGGKAIAFSQDEREDAPFDDVWSTPTYPGEPLRLLSSRRSGSYITRIRWGKDFAHSYGVKASYESALNFAFADASGYAYYDWTASRVGDVLATPPFFPVDGMACFSVFPQDAHVAGTARLVDIPGVGVQTATSAFYKIDIADAKPPVPDVDGIAPVFQNTVSSYDRTAMPVRTATQAIYTKREVGPVVQGFDFISLPYRAIDFGHTVSKYPFPITTDAQLDRRGKPLASFTGQSGYPLSSGVYLRKSIGPIHNELLYDVVQKNPGTGAEVIKGQLNFFALDGVYNDPAFANTPYVFRLKVIPDEKSSFTPGVAWAK